MGDTSTTTPSWITDRGISSLWFLLLWYQASELSLQLPHDEARAGISAFNRRKPEAQRDVIQWEVRGQTQIKTWATCPLSWTHSCPPGHGPASSLPHLSVLASPGVWLTALDFKDQAFQIEFLTPDAFGVDRQDREDDCWGGMKDKALSKNRVRKDQKRRQKVIGRVRQHCSEHQPSGREGVQKYHIQRGQGITGVNKPPSTGPNSIQIPSQLHNQVPNAIYSKRGFLGLD